MVGDFNISADKLTYTFKIRKDVTFHDGTPLTSADVKATFDRLREPPQGVVSVRQSVFKRIKAIATPDPETAVFHLSTASPAFLFTLASPFNCIYSAAKLAKSLDLGVNDYLMQPVDRNELLARVRTQIRRRRFQDRLRASYQQSLSMALTDQLTGLYNRNYLMTHLSGLMQRTIASELPYISLWCKTNVAIAQRSLTGIHVAPVGDFTFLKDVARTPDDVRVRDRKSTRLNSSHRT